MIHRVEIARLLIDEHSPSQSVVLREVGGQQRSILICIGSFEAVSISSTLNDEPFPRPLTHQLAACLIESLQGKLDKVVITDLKPLTPDEPFFSSSQMTFFAELHIRQGERLLVIDSRPSDALAISLVLKRPIYIEETLFE